MLQMSQLTDKNDSKVPLMSAHSTPPRPPHNQSIEIPDEPLSEITSHPFDDYLQQVFSSLPLERIRRGKFADILKWFQIRYCPKTRDRSEHCCIVWQNFVDHHSELLIQHLDDLQDSIMPFFKQPDLCDDIDFEKFSVYFEFSCINLDTLLSNVLYSSNVWATDWFRNEEKKKEIIAEIQEDQSATPSPLARTHSTPTSERRKKWVYIPKDDLEYMEKERDRQEEYSLISDGNYSYEVWDRLNEDNVELMKVGNPTVQSPNHRYRDALKHMARAVKQPPHGDEVGLFTACWNHIVRAVSQPVPSGQVGCFSDYWKPSQLFWAGYHFGEIMVPPLLLFIVEPSNIFSEGMKDFINYACAGIAIFFTLGGLRKIWLKIQSNVHSLTMAKRKHFLVKCMFVALLIRVVMLIDELVPTDDRLQRRREDPKTKASEQARQKRRASVPVLSTGTTSRSLSNSQSFTNSPIGSSWIPPANPPPFLNLMQSMRASSARIGTPESYSTAPAAGPYQSDDIKLL